jgi:hypothetical protein
VTKYGSEVFLNDAKGWIDEPTASLLQDELLDDSWGWDEATHQRIGWRSFVGTSQGLKGWTAEKCVSREYFWIWNEWPIKNCPGNSNGCFGFQDGRMLVVGAAPDRPNQTGPRRSAWKHEMCHHLQECLWGITDRNHTRPEWIICN